MLPSTTDQQITNETEQQTNPEVQTTAPVYSQIQKTKEPTPTESLYSIPKSTPVSTDTSKEETKSKSPTNYSVTEIIQAGIADPPSATVSPIKTSKKSGSTDGLMKIITDHSERAVKNQEPTIVTKEKSPTPIQVEFVFLFREFLSLIFICFSLKLLNVQLIYQSLLKVIGNKSLLVLHPLLNRRLIHHQLSHRNHQEKRLPNIELFDVLAVEEKQQPRLLFEQKQFHLKKQKINRQELISFLSNLVKIEHAIPVLIHP